MASPRAIQRRIKSIRNIAQVTRAMEMVAASKMRRAQQATLASRQYAAKSWEMLTYIASQPGRSKVLHPLLEERHTISSALIVMITSDRTLCGAYNVNIIRAATAFAAQHNKPVRFIAIGRRGSHIAARYGKDIVAEFTGLSERPTVQDVGPIAKVAISEFVERKSDQVFLAHTNYVNTLVQRPTIQQLLPIQPASDGNGIGSAVYLYEPDPETILNTVLPRFTELQIYQALLESVASEWASRMVAMRNATENAHDLIGDLTLAMNKARQASITKEMLEIAGGAEAQRAAHA